MLLFFASSLSTSENHVSGKAIDPWRWPIFVGGGGDGDTETPPRDSCSCDGVVFKNPCAKSMGPHGVVSVTTEDLCPHELGLCTSAMGCRQTWTCKSTLSSYTEEITTRAKPCVLKLAKQQK